MSAVEVFQFPATGAQIRTILIDGAPWFVGRDACAMLGISNASDALSRLDATEKGVAETDTLGGRQSVTVISEAGLYRLIMRSNRPDAVRIQMWIAHDVLPAIRRTGRYEVAPAAPAFPVPQSFADALELAARQARQIESQAAELEQARPAAHAWNVLASADGDLSVSDAAKTLSRDPAIKVGRDRLFTILNEFGWTYRQRSDGRWRPMQTAIERGRLSEIPKSHYHPRTGDLVLDPPQVRVTVKGLQELHKRLGGTAPLQLECVGRAVALPT